MSNLYLKKYKDFDWLLALSAFGIFLLGLLFLFSSTYPHNIEYVLKQTIWFLIGSLVVLALVNINYRKIVGIGSVFYALIILLLIAVLFFGSKRYGAQRWLSIGSINIQPSEFGKLFITIALVQYLTAQKTSYTFKTILIALVLMLIPFVLILREPDLGTALMFVPVVFALLFAWGIPKRILIFMIMCMALASPLGWFFLKGYQKARLLVFLNPDIDPLGAGYTIIQSKIAIGSGGIMGKGWLSGTQNQLNFLAERHTDFIFSVVGEEWGFLGGLVILALYYILIKRGLDIAERTQDPCGRLLAVGLTVMLGTQVVINLSMTMGFMPVVGLPLPLVSYGGSSLLVTMIAIGLLESIALHR